jgi:hypothetical protein
MEVNLLFGPIVLWNMLLFFMESAIEFVFFNKLVLVLYLEKFNVSSNK